MVNIRTDLCLGCGLCEELKPKIFKLKNNKAMIIKQPANKNSVNEAITSCPGNAIIK